jgi:hypothetical protein
LRCRKNGGRHTGIRGESGRCAGHLPQVRSTRRCVPPKPDQRPARQHDHEQAREYGHDLDLAGPVELAAPLDLPIREVPSLVRVDFVYDPADARDRACLAAAGMARVRVLVRQGPVACDGELGNRDVLGDKGHQLL